jgi:carboxypeptidase Taq
MSTTTAAAPAAGQAHAHASLGDFPHYHHLRRLLRQASVLGSVGSALGWDQETYMPPQGGAHRAEQLSAMAELTHATRTDPRIGELIHACESDKNLLADPVRAANIREIRRDYDRATKLPPEFVAEVAKTTSLAQDAWKDARAKSNFAHFAPWLEKVLGLMRTKAKLYGLPPSGELYDALLDEYEPGTTAAQIQAIFDPLQARLAPLVAALVEAKHRPADVLAGIDVPQPQQHAFGLEVLKAIGFDLQRGRLDTTTHPFCTELGPHDTRLTTRYNTSSCLEPLSSTMHEAGHGMYEQGLPKDAHYGEPLADAISLGIHESQSRLWENLVGRSRAFWTWALPVAKRLYAGKLDHLTLDQVYAAVNLVERSFIRVESDEATYNLHIMLRFGLERALVSGDLSVNDLPAAWNARFKQLLGLEVPDDKRGCLQDVHWSFGLVGYFPTYTLGNLHAAQFWEKMHQDLPALDAQMAQGDFTAIKRWLNTNIHAHGRQFRAGELCQRVTGKPLSADPFMRVLEGKLRPLYNL